MPLSVTTTAGGTVHPSPFIGPINHTVQLLVDISTLSADEVDASGYIRPGTILQQTGAAISAPAQIAYGCVVEATKVATGVAGLATEPDVEVGVALYCVLNRDIMEDSMGRVLSADELAAIDVAGSHVAITNT